MKTLKIHLAWKQQTKKQPLRPERRKRRKRSLAKLKKKRGYNRKRSDLETSTKNRRSRIKKLEESTLTSRNF